MPQVPPPGYDDPSIIPNQILVNVVTHLENELEKTERVYQKFHPEVLHLDGELEKLRQSAEDLSERHQELVDRIITSYQDLAASPDQSHFDRLFENVQVLKSFLTH